MKRVILAFFSKNINCDDALEFCGKVWCLRRPSLLEMSLESGRNNIAVGLQRLQVWMHSWMVSWQIGGSCCSYGC